MSFPRYPEYKDSGVEWQGAVPVHWEKSALKYLGEYVNGYPFKPTDWGTEGLPIIRIAQLTGGAEPSFYSGELGPRLKIKDGDLLFSWSATIDSFIWEGSDAWLNQHIFKVFPSKESNKIFLYYLIKLVAPKLADYDAHGSTMRHIKKESLSERLFVPPVSEQQNIVTFLDHETARIDALIEEQQRLIELLKEKRQAVISHAVTKGADPNVPMKDSGVEWLGEVPAHWAMTKIKYEITIFEQGWSPQCDNIPANLDNEWAALKVGCVNGGIFDPLENKRLPENLDPQPALSVKAGDVLISRANTRELVGSAAAAVGNYPRLMISDKLFRLRTSKTLLPEFLATYLSTPQVRPAIEIEATGASSSMLNIGQTTIKELPVALPPISEQQKTMELVRNELLRIIDLHKETKKALELLQERRSALISAAVTGKIDVRDWQAKSQSATSELPKLAEHAGHYTANEATP